MRPNPLKHKVLRDDLAVGIIMLSADPHVVGIAAEAGFDFILADLEHTGCTLRELELLVRTADACGIVPTARVAGPTKADILAVLEAGVQGIMVPAVESVAEAREVVNAARYAPFGKRGVYYMGYGSGYGAQGPLEHFRTASEELFIMLQIETAKGVQAAPDIAGVPGVDCLFVGPGDLTASLGIPWEFDHPALWDAIHGTFRAARLGGKAAGIMPPGIEHAARSHEAGARVMLWGPDLGMFQRAAREDASLLAERLHWKKAGGRPA